MQRAGHVQAFDHHAGALVAAAAAFGYMSSNERPSISSTRCSRVTSPTGCGGDMLAVAQHRDGIAELEYLAQTVRDVDDRAALRRAGP